MNQRILMPFFTMMMVVSLLSIAVLEARGGGGRGAGGQGGRGRAAHGGGKSLQRSLSMSRTSNVRSSTARQAASTRPTRSANAASQTRSAGGKSSINQRSNERAQTRNEVQNFLQERPGDRPAERAGQGVLNRQDQRSVEMSARSLADRHDFGQSVRREIGENRVGRGAWFNDNFWDRYNYIPPYYTHDRNWWQWGTALGVAGWLGWGTAPIYYDYPYGDDGYWNSSADLASTQAYSDATQFVESSTTQESGSGEWMPLGVFGLSKERETAATPNIFMQLALNKQGMISGTLYNATMDQVYEVEGEVDKRTQRAAWKVVGNEKAPFIEAGIYNLTQSEVPARVYFPNGTTQQMLLIRLDKP